jgi:uncharacterized FAD-dependent dehydrogenase
MKPRHPISAGAHKEQPEQDPGRPIRTCQIRLPLGHSEQDLLRAIDRVSPGTAGKNGSWQIVRRSIDARRRGAVQISYTVCLNARPQPLQGLAALPWLQGPRAGRQKRPRPVIVGSGPAGLFAALALTRAGCEPLILERGQPVADRQRAVERFFAGGELDPENNVQFGEGGAGTFSDGKLSTGIHDPRCRAVLEELVLAGAPDSILVDAAPHIGSDLLREVVTRLRQKIEAGGGTFCFGTRLDDLDLAYPGGPLAALVLSRQGETGGRAVFTVPARQAILAMGHSARDTLAMLARRGVPLEPKPFSLGVRIEHPQTLIDQSQYGPAAGHRDLPPASYKLAVHLPSGRSVYTFCMCPGGQVVAAASEPGGVVTNGMSLHARAQSNANSALLVNVTPADFPGPEPLAGVALQRQLERLAFAAGGGSYRAPAQLVGDFLAGSPSTGPGSIMPSYQPGVAFGSLNTCLPEFVLSSLKEALPLFDRKIKGFARPDAVLTGVETRSSSPVRIVRDDTLQSKIRGLYPCGEGAGYAGGILSAAVDGLRCAEALLTAGA